MRILLFLLIQKKTIKKTIKKNNNKNNNKQNGDVEKELKTLDSLDPKKLQKKINDINTAAKRRIKAKTSITETLEENLKKSKENKNYKYRNFYADLKRAIKNSPRDYEANEFIDAIDKDEHNNYQIPPKIKQNLVAPFYADLKKENAKKSKDLVSRLKKYDMFKDIDNIKNETDLNKKDEWIEKHIKNEKELTDIDDFIDIYNNILPSNYKRSCQTLITHINGIRNLKKQKSNFIDSLKKIEHLDMDKISSLFDLLTNEFFNDDPTDLFSEKDEIKNKEDFIKDIIGKIKFKIKRHNLEESIQKLEKIEKKIIPYFDDIKKVITEILNWNKQLIEFNKLPNIYFDKFLPKDKNFTLYQFTLYAQNISSKQELEKVIDLINKMDIKDPNFKTELIKILNEEKTYLIDKEKIIKEIPEFTKPGGIPNGGNTCYAASLFQILSSSYPEPFYLYDVDLKRKKRILKYIEKVSYEKNAIKSLKDEISTVEKGKDIITKSKNLIENVRKGINSINVSEIIESLISKKLFVASEGTEEDSQEFLDAIYKILPSDNYCETEEITSIQNQKYSQTEKHKYLMISFPPPYDYDKIEFNKLMKHNFSQNEESEKENELIKFRNNFYKKYPWVKNTFLNTKKNA